ncbi:MAG TPA: geranylgeranyl reductase family protein [Chloroflexota bacterium]|jgi:geranylgeranyl reductase family protein
MHDVAIVGAGPGGSATAHFLARRGLDVLLLDKATFPRDKTCGDGLTSRALRVLDAMGILPEVSGHGCPIDGYEVVAPNGKKTTARITSSPAAMVVRRLTLDHIILKRAVASGARFEPGVGVTRVEPEADRVIIRAGLHSFEARHAVLATGAATGVLKASGIVRHQPRAMLAARAYVTDLPATSSSFQLQFGGVPQPGYGWVFPVNQEVANVGVGFLPKGRKHTAQAVFDTWLKTGRLVDKPKGFPIRVDFLTSPTYAPRTLLVGEAAGLVNPLTGEGIDYALESGQIAAHFIDQPLAYHQALHARFGKIFRFSEQVRDWYCQPVLLNHLVPLANRRPELRQLLASIVLGEREPAGFGPLHMLARLLVYLARTRPQRLQNA